MSRAIWTDPVEGVVRASCTWARDDTSRRDFSHAKIWMRDDTTLGVNNISDAVIADLGLLHNVPHWREIEFDNPCEDLRI